MKLLRWITWNNFFTTIVEHRMITAAVALGVLWIIQVVADLSDRAMIWVAIATAIALVALSWAALLDGFEGNYKPRQPRAKGGVYAEKKSS